MGAFDKIVAAVSPRRACEREAWRQQLEILRGYDAAGYGRLNAGWRVHNESAEVTDRFSRDVVRARARDLERNSDIAQSILHAYKRNVVGKGYTLQAKTGNDELDEKLEKAWRGKFHAIASPPFQACGIITRHYTKFPAICKPEVSAAKKSRIFFAISGQVW